MIEYRPAQSSDFDGVVQLLRQLWLAKPINPSVLKPIFERIIISRHYLCAIHQDLVIGFGGVSFRDNLWQEGTIAFVEELVVDAAYRGKGVGREIMRRLHELAQSRGCKRLELDSGFHRVEAHHFYEGLGMEKRAYLFSQKLPDPAI